MNRFELARRRRHNIRIYLKRGLNYYEIAPLVGLSRQRVWQIAKELGHRAPPRMDLFVGSERAATFSRLRAGGATFAEIADEMGVSLSTLNEWARQLKLDKRKIRPPGKRQLALLEALEDGPARPGTIVVRADDWNVLRKMKLKKPPWVRYDGWEMFHNVRGEHRRARTYALTDEGRKVLNRWRK